MGLVSPWSSEHMHVGEPKLLTSEATVTPSPRAIASMFIITTQNTDKLKICALCPTAAPHPPDSRRTVRCGAAIRELSFPMDYKEYMIDVFHQVTVVPDVDRLQLLGLSLPQKYGDVAG